MVVLDLINAAFSELVREFTFVTIKKFNALKNIQNFILIVSKCI